MLSKNQTITRHLNRFGLPGFVQARVLIVDDIATNRFLLRASAEQIGIGLIEDVESGEACLERLRRPPQPDLVLLDVMMPGLDGFETCRRIREELGLSDLPVVLQTALNSAQDRIAGFKAGATDYVTKPLNTQELGARLQVHLVNRLLMRRLTDFHARLTAELDVAHRMQRQLIPNLAEQVETMTRMGLGLDAHWVPCDEVGGDLWWIRQIDDRRVALFLMDIVGHGLVAAINVFRIHGMLKDLAADPNDPGAWLGALNRRICTDLDGDVFATALYGIVDLDCDSFRYAAAGAPEPLIFNRNGSFHLAETRGLLLGGDLDTVYPPRIAPLGPGGAVLLYSDALTESASEAGSTLSPADLADMLAEIGPIDRPLPGLLARFARQVPPPWPDDLTLVWVSRQD